MSQLSELHDVLISFSVEEKMEFCCVQIMETSILFDFLKKMYALFFTQAGDVRKFD